MKRRSWLWIGAWTLATLLIALLAREVDLPRLSRAIEGGDWRWLAAAMVANLLIQPLGAAQWRALLPLAARPPMRRMLRLFSITSLASNTTPSIIGHATGAILLGEQPAVGRSASVAVMALDQLCVGIAKLAVIAAAIALTPIPSWMRAGFTALGIAVGVLLGTIIVAGMQRDRVGRWVETAQPRGVRGRALNALARVTVGLEAARNPAQLGAGLLCAALVKGAEGAGIALVMRAFGLPITGSSVLLVLVATSLSSVVPFSIANIGPYEAASYAAYRALGQPPESALGIAIAQHVCLLIPAVIPGYLLLLMRSGSHPQPKTEAQRAGVNDAESQLVVPRVDRP